MPAPRECWGLVTKGRQLSDGRRGKKKNNSFPCKRGFPPRCIVFFSATIVDWGKGEGEEKRRVCRSWLSGFAVASLLRLGAHDTRCNYVKSIFAALCETLKKNVYGMTPIQIKFSLRRKCSTKCVCHSVVSIQSFLFFLLLLLHPCLFHSFPFALQHLGLINRVWIKARNETTCGHLTEDNRLFVSCMCFYVWWGSTVLSRGEATVAAGAAAESSSLTHTAGLNYLGKTLPGHTHAHTHAQQHGSFYTVLVSRF